MTAPRFLLVFGKASDRPAPRWPGGSLPFIGDLDAHGSWMAWRLAGANNRELGRSAQVYADLSCCRDSIMRLRDGVSAAAALVAMDYVSGLWVWQLRLEGSNVAVGGRAYRRERECRDNLQHFLTAAPVADMPFDVPPPSAPSRHP